MQTRSLILSSAFAALALGAAAVLLRSDEPVVQEPVVSTPAIAWRVGERQRYAVELRSEIDIRGASSAHYVHRLTGSLDLQVFAVGAERVRIGCQLSGVEQSVDGAARNEPLLSSFFVASATRDGRFAEFQFPKALDGETRNRLREMLRLFQVVVPAGAGASWTTEEADANGSFVAVYRAAQGMAIRKARIRYTTQDARILDSKTSAQLSRDGFWLERISTDERSRVRGAGDHVVTASVTGRLQRTAMPAAWRGDLLAAISRADAAVIEVQQAIDAQRRRPATAADRRRFQTVIRDLDAAGKLGNGLLDALRDAMLDCPELAASVPDLVAAGDLQDLTASALIHALRMAGHAEAQQALGAIATDPRQTRQNRTRAIIDLGGVARPSDASCTELWQLSLRRATEQSLADTAMLALGRIGKTLRAVDAGRYDAMRGQLATTLQTAADAGERSTVLTAMGNTADPALLAAVADHLRGSEPQVRVAAAKALGRIGGGQERVLATLSTERNPAVRRQLVDSLCAAGGSTTASLQRIGAMIGAETDDATRLSMARFLGANLERYPEGRATLRELLRNEANNRVRKYVAGVVFAGR